MDQQHATVPADTTEPFPRTGLPAYRFGAFELDVAERRLLRDGSPVAIPPRAFDVLVILVEHRGSLVTKEELMRRVWTGTVVEDANLSVTVSAVRRAIGRELIATVPKYGYRFTGRVEQLGTANPRPETRPGARSRPSIAVAPLLFSVIALALAVSWQTPDREVPRWSSPLPSPEVRRLTHTSSRELEPSWSSRGRLVFTVEDVGNPDIYTAGADGGGLTRLTDHPGRDEHPVWSPDGQWIAFVSDREETRQIYVMRADGSEVRRVTARPYSCSEPSWSPDGLRLAFQCSVERDVGQNIYVAPVWGGAVERLTAAPVSDTSPAWSPDGQWVVFASNRYGPGADFDIYVIASSGGEPRRLTLDAGSEMQPAWSPDGDRIAFTSIGSGGEPAVHLVHADGTGIRRLSVASGADPAWSPDGSEVVYSSTHEGNVELVRQPVETAIDVTRHAGRDAFGAWSADGRYLAFTSSRHGLLALFVADAAGGGVRRLTDGRANDWFPSWSPDGTRLVFQSDRAGADVLDLCIVDVRDRRSRCITSGPGIKGSPAWSPDGAEIVFQSNMRGGPYDFQIYAVRPDGSGLRRITTTSAYDADPSWSPDGSRIAFASDRIDRQFDVFTMKRDGSDVRRLTFNPARDVNPWWAPDGRRLVFASNRTTRTERHELYVTSAEGRSAQRITARGGWWPRWSPHGDAVLFTSSRHRNEDLVLLALPPEMRAPPSAASLVRSRFQPSRGVSR